LLTAVAGQRFGHVALRLAPAHLSHDAVRKAQLAVRAGADAEVVAELPVVEVVHAAVAAACEGRDLVALQAGRDRALADQVEHVAGQVVVRQAGGGSSAKRVLGSMVRW
jgi:hypothetical protein